MAWKIDPAHSQINFSAKHLMISTVRGQFREFSAKLDLDEAQPTNSKVEIDIVAASLDTGNEQRDGHLRSADFLDAEHYPTIKFVSTRVEQTGPREGRLYGNLTIRGVTREVPVHVEYGGKMTTPWGATSAGFEARTKINRKDWGLTWNQVLEAGALLVGEEIKIDIELELVYQADELVESDVAEAVGA